MVPPQRGRGRLTLFSVLLPVTKLTIQGAPTVSWDGLRRSHTVCVKSETSCVCPLKPVTVLNASGLEQCKAREDEAGADEDSGAKDLLIKRKLPGVMMGQAISVVGANEEKAPAATAVKRLPEPILPTAQAK